MTRSPWRFFTLILVHCKPPAICWLQFRFVYAGTGFCSSFFSSKLWFSVLACRSLQLWRQYFVLWSHFSNVPKNSYWIFQFVQISLFFWTEGYLPNSLYARLETRSLVLFFKKYLIIRSDQISLSVMSDSLRPHESQHARLPCPSPTPRVHSKSRPSSQLCHPAISSSVVPFSSYPQSLPASESFPMSQLLA